MTDYQLHVIDCIERFNRLHICNMVGTGLPVALAEAMRRTNFDWWFVAPKSYLAYAHTCLPDNVTPFTLTQWMYEVEVGQMLMPCGLVLVDLTPRLPVHPTILTLVDKVRQVYGENMKLVTVGPAITLGHI